MGTSCPPPLRNLNRMPRIRFERPVFHVKYGQAVADLARDVPQREVKAPQDM
jgi:hypothetical protein